MAAGGRTQLTPDQIDLAARLLEPRVPVVLRGELRTFAELSNLERLSDLSTNGTDAFHRVYRGQHPTRRDRVILHLYDLSATQEKQALDLARREFDTIQRWQKSPYVPSLLDSFQEAEGYPGELVFYSLVDPAAPTIAERSKDQGWDLPARLTYVQTTLAALREFHQPQDPNLPAIVHRRLSPNSLHVRHNNQPLFTGFNLTRLQDAETLASIQVDFGDLLPFVAEEVRQGGLAAADARSDIAALCASLLTLLTLFKPEEARADQVRSILELGCAPKPADRPTLDDLARALAALTPGDTPATPHTLPPADYWDEDTVVDFQQSRYKIVGRLGRGGIGQAFKVVELDGHSDEKFGTYVAKLVRQRADGETAIRAYRQVRAYTTHPNLSTIHEIAPDWEPDRFLALMKWVEGLPLQDLTGVLALYAEDLGEGSAETLIHRWLLDLCAALGELHRVGLVHGDVSPKNLIVQGGSIVLTDYDTVTPVGTAARGGTLPYTSPQVQSRAAIQPADDLYALAASLFQVLTDREPFAYGAERCKELGLNWNGIADYANLRPFFDHATHPDPLQRFPDALTARGFLADSAQETREDDNKEPFRPTPPTLTPNAVHWLRHLLSAYPGSRHGNSETRGLDSPFAEATYVETRLDDTLLAEIEAGDINLVILFGNAGDGKTAFLQHLAQRLGLPDIHSSRRVWETYLDGGRQLKDNLDGAAAWEGQSANTMLDDLFRPFHNPNFSRGRVHIVAVNNGKLLEWVETQEEDTWLTEPLRRVLLGEDDAMEEPRFRLIDLNRRSLVGGIDQGRLTTDFLDTLIDRLLGGDTDPWKPCSTCTAQGRCTAWHSVQSLRDPDQGLRLRQRLTDLLPACHQRGEIHITARELRAALSYCLFGVHDCAELHAESDLRPSHYWQRAFDAQSPQRQGELLAEMARFDPALEAEPILDRRLLREPGSNRVEEHLTQARRRAWFTRPVGAVSMATQTCGYLADNAGHRQRGW